MRKISNIIRCAFILAAITFAANPLWAAPVSVQTAEQVARNFWNLHHGKEQSPLTAPMEQIALPFDGMYLFGTTDGFVLTAADDCVRPVLAYSFNHSAIDHRGLNPELSYWLSIYQSQIDNARSLGLKADNRTVEEWQTLRSGNGTKDETTTVGPLVTTHWDQEDPYNMLCPTKYYYRTVTGCVATAMAQVMRYWSHPLRGTGSHSYRCQLGYSSKTLSANFGNTVYDWENMPNSLTSVSSNAEKTAVATLIYHCGVAVEMEYETADNGGSGAMTSPTPAIFYSNSLNAMITHFGYSSNTTSIRRQHFSDSAWTAIVRGEIDALRPILYCGYGVDGGHCFVCDGYDDRGYFHFNWGWSGVGDGYFSLDNLTPGTGGAGGGSYSFTDGQEILLGLRPADPDLDDSLCIVRHFPYYVDFEDGPTCWSAEDLDAEGMSWLCYDTIGVLGNQSAIAVPPTYYSVAHDILYSPYIIAPGNYTIRWQDRAFLSGGTDHYTLNIGADTLFSTNVTSTDWNTREAHFTVEDTMQLAFTYRGTRSASRGIIIDSIVITSDNAGIADVRPASHARLYPNPTTDRVTIESSLDIAAVELYDTFGRRLSVSKPFSGSLDLSALAPGVYLLRLLTPSATETLRVVKH